MNEQITNNTSVEQASKQTKTGTKKTKNVIKYPTSGFFTIKELWAQNTQFPAYISIQTKLVDRVKQNDIVTVLGTLGGGIGRPQAVYAMLPITDELLQKAQEKGIMLDEKYNKVIVPASSPRDIIEKVMDASMTKKEDRVEAVV